MEAQKYKGLLLPGVAPVEEKRVARKVNVVITLSVFSEDAAQEVATKMYDSISQDEQFIAVTVQASDGAGQARFSKDSNRVSASYKRF